MPRKKKTSQAQPVQAATDTGQLTKTHAVRAALETYPDTPPKEIADMLRAQGWDVKGQYVSTVKAKMKGAGTSKRAAARPARKTAARAPKSADSISLDSLKKAKELAAQLGGIEKAKAAIAALSELLD
jgi:hypothetical protein